MSVIVVSGPTATGKTNMAIELAQTFGGEVVNFDSLLLYKEINIGTAKPTIDEMRGIPHHMIDVASISAPMNASDYMRMSYPIVEKLLRDNKNVYLVGGSGFYLQALLKGMYDSPTTPTEVLKRSEELYSQDGIAPFLDVLRENDPGSYSRYHENDHYRIRRAAEHWWTHGTPFFELRQRKTEEVSTLEENNAHGWKLFHAYMDIPKTDHIKIIEARTDRMIKQGLIEEVKSLIDLGFTGDEKPLQSIGYKEAVDFIRGNFETIDECRERINISTRQLAKSQRTWFNRDPHKTKYHPIEELEKIKADVSRFLE